jgi:hypothetical protein
LKSQRKWVLKFWCKECFLCLYKTGGSLYKDWWRLTYYWADIPLPNLLLNLQNFEKSQEMSVDKRARGCFLGLYKTDWKFIKRLMKIPLGEMFSTAQSIVNLQNFEKSEMGVAKLRMQRVLFWACTRQLEVYKVDED